MATAAAPSTSSQTMTSTDIKYYMPLYRASMEGDWESAKRFLDSDPNALTARIDEYGNTALCIAAKVSRHTKFIEELVELMPPEALVFQDRICGETALYHVGVNGNTKAAKILVNKNPNLTQIRTNSGKVPLVAATLYGHKEFASYLCSVTRDEDPSPFRGESGAYLLNTAIRGELYDLALHLLELYPEMATTKRYNGDYAINTLAIKSWPSYMNVVPEVPNMIFTNALKELASTFPSIQKLYETKNMHRNYLKLVTRMLDEVRALSNLPKIQEIMSGTILVATQHGNLELVKSILKVDPSQIWTCTNVKEHIFQFAIKYRQENIFSYLKGFGLKDQLASLNNNPGEDTLLHFAAKLAPLAKLQARSGAALQMQYDLQWYKEVEKIVQPLYNFRKNAKQQLPREMFTKEHENLAKEGEKWMKDMASSSMVVAILIATVVFTAAITVPGGNISDKGIPVFLHTESYMIFAVSNALAFFFSLTSVLIFLSILTARFAEEDFLRSLPRRLIIGLTMLFFSIATTTIAFSATYFIMLGHQLAWISILIALLTCFPVTLFAIFQFPLFLEIVRSTYRFTM